MRLAKLRIRNFRAIRHLDIDVQTQTVLIGGNGVGKSCIIRALDKFFGKSVSVSEDDFFQRNIDEPIEIALTFADFTPAEAEAFGERIHSDEMTVVRVFNIGAGKDTGRYYGMTPRHSGFDGIRAIASALPKRSAYQAKQGEVGYDELRNCGAVAQVDEALREWEAAHPHACELGRDDGQFFGFTNVFRGFLGRYIAFVFVPAVKDATADAVDSKNSAIGQLIELVVRGVIEQREDIQAWRAKASAEYQELTSPENVGELDDLSGELTNTLSVYYEDTGVDLQWKPAEDLVVPLPTADVLLTEQGFTGPVQGKGHGLQRALIFTLLQHLARATRFDMQEEAPDDAPPADARALILAIEEPELYQHPSKQRHLSRVLWEISQGQHPGILSGTQIMFCSHSPYFVSTERFPEIGLARREIVEAEIGKECVVRRVNYERIVEVLAKVWEGEGFTTESLMARLHVLRPEVAEGFFASAAVLVEGASDRAAILGTAMNAGIDLEGKGISVVEAGGKSNLDRIAIIFRELGVPTYLVWDSDDHLPEADKKVSTNRALQRICGVEAPAPVDERVEATYACFAACLERKLQEEIPALDEATEWVWLNYGLPKRKVLKNPAAMTKALEICAEKGQRSAFLESIIERVIALADG